jgi:hypothetical protein
LGPAGCVFGTGNRQAVQAQLACAVGSCWRWQGQLVAW